MEVRDARATSEFVEQFATAMVEAGMSRMPARVFAKLLTEDEGSSTAARLAEALKASPAAISGAIAYLTQVRLVAKERRPGDRHDTYRLHNQVWYEAIYSREHEMERYAAIIRDGAEAVGRDTPAGRRMVDTAEFFEFLQAEMSSMLERWRERRSAEPGG